MKKTSIARIDLALRELGRSTDIKARLSKLKSHDANSEWEGSVEEGNLKKVRVKSDPDKVGRVVALVHELLHIHFEWMADMGNLDWEVEEEIVTALEKKLVERFNEDERRWTAWRKIVKHIYGG